MEENTNKNAFLEIKHLEKIYPNGAKAVFDFNLSINKNEFIVIVGPSGCGKSTTLRMIAGLEDISDGDIYLENELLNYKPSKDRNIAIVFQSYALYPQMNVFENIAFPLTINTYPYPIVDVTLHSCNQLINLLNKIDVEDIKKAVNEYSSHKKSLKIPLNEYICQEFDISLPSVKLLLSIYKGKTKDELINILKQKFEEEVKENANKNLKYNEEFQQIDDNGKVILKHRKMEKYEIKEKVYATAKTLDLGDYLDRLPKELSGGQMQRVALGRAIVKNVPLFLMDEPLSNLDAKLRLTMRSEIVKLHNKINTTTIYVTHDQTEAMTMASRIVVMSKGFVQQIGTPEEIYNNPINLFVAKFIGSPSMNVFDATFANNKLIIGNNTISLSDEFINRHNAFYDEKMSEFLKIKNGFSSDTTKKQSQEKILKILSALSDEKKGTFTKQKPRSVYDKIRGLFKKDNNNLTEENKELEVCNDKISKIEDALVNSHKIFVGIRPEKMKIRFYDNKKLKDNEVKVFVTISELLGAEYNVHFNFNNLDVVCRFSVDKKINIGDCLVLTLDLNDALFFDSITGERIY